jgi:hypothetical protein
LALGPGYPLLYQCVMTEREQWDGLVTELDTELLLYGPVRYQLGKILYQMKIHLHKHGLDRGRKGRWESILRERQAWRGGQS